MTGAVEKPMAVAAAEKAWREHRFFKYRGCAPDPDDPKQAMGDPSLSLDAWHGSDRDGAEPQKERRAREAAAKRVCGGCAVREACAVYANSVTPEGKLAFPEGLMAGRLGRERREAFARARQEVSVVVPDVQLLTAQKRAVMLALAMCTDALEVARAAGLPIRTANWQRSRLVTQFGLNDGASRGELLAEAVRRGLLDGGLVVADDGSVPAVPAPGSVGVEAPVQLALWHPDTVQAPAGADVHQLPARTTLGAAA